MNDESEHEAFVCETYQELNTTRFGMVMFLCEKIGSNVSMWHSFEHQTIRAKRFIVKLEPEAFV